MLYNLAFFALLAAQGHCTQGKYYQCAGKTWNGGTICEQGTTCQYQNPWYSQCLEPSGGGSQAGGSQNGGAQTGGSQNGGSQNGGSAPVRPPTVPTPAGPTTLARVTTGGTTNPTGTKTPTVIGSAPGSVAVAGVNIAGCDFGCNTNGYCTTPNSCPSSTGPTQMQHFVKDDGMNIFRLPVGWQYLVDNNVDGTIATSFGETYDALVKACLATSANTRCIIDIHNYARWNGGIIGQGGPTNDQFVKLWTQLAKKYASQSNVVFGIMNEPHDLDMTKWAATVQLVVNAIRNAGAVTQWILLPGTGYTGAGTFSTDAGPQLSKVTNPAGSTTGLIYDVHQYFDSDHSGTYTTCDTNEIDSAFQPLATWLKGQKRQALLSETGAGNNADCATKVCAALQFLSTNSDVYLGWTGWAAGGFDANYPLTETPVGGKDTLLVRQCIAGAFKSHTATS